MIKECFKLWSREEYKYPVKGNFIPNIVTYIHDEDESIRPALLVVPGGGYTMVSSTEGEIVAKEFYNKGYNTFVLTYTTNLLRETPLKKQPLKDMSKAVVLIRKNSNRFRIDPNRLAICGFSAGAHLVGSLAVHYKDKDLILNDEYKDIGNRPNAVILSYPVITSGEYAHKDSFICLLGETATREELEYMSLEKHVTSDTPPVFVWQTATDELVPVENSYLFANSCKENGVYYEHHVFGHGKHGMSLANENWANNNFGDDYTLEQFYETLKFLIDNKVELPPPFDIINNLENTDNIIEKIREGMKSFSQQNKPDSVIAIWPELVDNWLKKII